MLKELQFRTEHLAGTYLLIILYSITIPWFTRKRLVITNLIVLLMIIAQWVKREPQQLYITLHNHNWQIEIIADKRSYFWGDTSSSGYNRLMHTRKYLGVKRFTKDPGIVQSIYFGKNHIEIRGEQIIINKHKIVHPEKRLPMNGNFIEAGQNETGIELYPIKPGEAFVMQLH